MDDVYTEMSELGSVIGTWLLEQQRLSMTDSAFLLTGLLALIAEDIWAEDTRPPQIQRLMAALHETGDLLAGLVILVRAHPDQLPNDSPIP